MMAHNTLKKIVILTAAIPAFLLVVIMGFQFLLETGTARRLLQNRVNAVIPGHISWEAQSLSIFKGQIAIEQLRLQGPEKDDIITADGLAIDVGLRDLADREVVIQTARLNRPAVFLKAGAHGQLNLIRALLKPVRQPEPEAETTDRGSAFNIRVNEMVLEQGRLFYEKTDAPATAETQKLRLENIRISLAAAELSGRSGRLEVIVGDGRVGLAGIDAPIRRFRLSAVLAGGRLDPLNLELDTAEAKINLSGTVARIFDKPDLDVKLALAAELSEIRQMLNMKTALSGPVLLDMTAIGSLENPGITMKLNYTGGRLAEIDVQQLDLESRMTDRTIVIDRLDADTTAGKIESAGAIDLQTAFSNGLINAPADLSAIAYQLDLKVSDGRLSGFPGLPPMSGDLTASLHLAGRGISSESLTAEADMAIQGKNIIVDKTIQPLDLIIAARTKWARGRLCLDSLTINSPGADLAVSGQYVFSENRLDLRANAAIPDLETLLAPLGVSGVSGNTVKIDADISGTVDQPAAKAELHANRLAIGDIVIGDLTGDAGFADGRVYISSLDLRNNESRASLKGSLQVLDKTSLKKAADPVMDLTLSADRVFLQDFASGLSGQLKISGDIGGSLRHPTGKFNLESGELFLDGQPLNAVRLATRVEDRKIIIAPLEIFLSPGQGLRAQGWVSLDRDYELDINSDLIDIKTINRMAGNDLEGRVRISARGAGRFNDPRLTGQVSLSGLTAGNKDLPDMEITIDLKDQEFLIKTADPFAVNVTYNLTGHDFSAAADLAETELAPFFRIADRREFSGQVTGMLKADGNTKNIGQMQASLKIENLNILQNGKAFLRTNALSADLKNGGITIPNSRITLFNEGYVNIRGTALATETLDGNLNISADGYIPATLIGALVPDIDQPEGSFRMAVKILGSVKQPVISGEINLESVGLKMAGTMQKLHEINGRITLSDQAIIVSGVKGQLDDGTFTLEGSIRIDHFEPMQADLRFNAHALPVDIDGMLEMRVNSDLKLSGRPDKSSLSGSVEVLAGDYFKDVNLSLIDTAGEIGHRKRQTAPLPEKSNLDLPFLKNLSLDVALTSRSPFVVDNNLALLNIIPTLRLHGDTRSPLISGRAEVSGGTITYRDTEFEVKKGVIDFVNPYRIEPTVDIHAEARVRKWVITLSAGGTPENLDFKLSSNPPEADADILSLLFIGKTNRELAEGSGGNARSPEELLANLVAGKIAGQVKEETGLDIVEVEYRKNGSDAHDAGEVKVTVGKELSRRLTVKYGVENKSGEVVQQSTAIYKLFENLSVNAFQDTGGDFGGEMRYRLEFR